MSKTNDPAVLFYISNWLTSTAEMDADERGWYLNLLLHQYDKGSLPNDVEKLATLAVVKFSEFDRFKKVFEKSLKHKFTENEEGRLENGKMKQVLKQRINYKDKRTLSGKKGQIMKKAEPNKKERANFQEVINNINEDGLDFIMKLDKQMVKHLLKHLLKLYINRNRNINIDLNIIKEYYIKTLKSLEDKKEIKKFIPPTKEEVIQYFQEKGYRKDVAIKAWNYYQAGNWHDKNGDKIKNWKQKMISVWFRPENESPKRTTNLAI